MGYLDYCSCPVSCAVAWFVSDIRGVGLMDYCRCFSHWFIVAVCLVSALILPSSAAESPYSVRVDASGPMPVYIVSQDAQVMPFSTGGIDDPPFYGSAWAVGSVSGLGECTLYFPINRREYVGVDRDGALFNVSDQTWSGVMYDAGGQSYQVSFGSFSLPRYRDSVGSSWSYADLSFIPSDSNLVLPTELSPVYSFDGLLPYLGVLMGGVILLCCIRRL